MSKQYFKITIISDNNMGGTDLTTIYCLQNNSSDYREFFNEDGSNVICNGTDSYCEYLSYALKLEEHIYLKTYGCKIDEIYFKDLPKNIQDNLIKT